MKTSYTKSVRLNQLIIAFLGLFPSCLAEEKEGYYTEPMYYRGPVKFVFNEWEDIKIKDYHNSDSYWSLYHGICTIGVYLELLQSSEELSVFRNGLIVNLMPFIDINNLEDFIEVKLSFREGEISDILNQSNLDKLEETFGINNRILLEEYARLQIITIEWDKDYEYYILRIKLPAGSSEHIYKKAFIYSIETMDKYISSYANFSAYFQLNEADKSIVEDASIVCKVLSLRMLMRTLIEPDLFTLEDKRVVFILYVI